MNKEKKWIMTINHINTKQLTEKQWNKKNPWKIEVTTIKKKPKTKKIKEANTWIVKTYSYRNDGKLDTWRPTKIDESCIKKLQEAFMADCTVEEACAYAGISPTIYYERLKKDKVFAERMDESSKLFLVDVKIRNKELIMAADQDKVSWALIKNALEKRDPNYKPKAEVENNTTVNVSFVWIAMRAKEQRMEVLDAQKQEKALENKENKEKQ